MNFLEFQAFVKENFHWLQGVHPDTPENIAGFEEKLGFLLPPSMKWLLSEIGYSMACGVEDLENSVKLTLDCRAKISLPKDIFIINDWNDGGVVFLRVDQRPDQEYEIIWSDNADLHLLIEGKPLPHGNDIFENFPAWVEDRVRFEQEEAKFDSI